MITLQDTRISSRVFRRVLLISAGIFAVVVLGVLEVQAQVPIKTGSSVEVQPVTLKEELKRIILPKVEFKNLPADQAFAYLAKKGRELAIDQKGPGINVVLMIDRQKPMPIVTLSLEDIPLGEALRYVATYADLSMRIEARAVLIEEFPKGKAH